MPEYIHTGRYHSPLTHYLDRWPELRTADEGRLFRFGEYWQRLFGLWVNSAYLLDYCPHEVVMVHGETGSSSLLSDHRDYPNWKHGMTAGEFYSHTGFEWVDRLAEVKQ